MTEKELLELKQAIAETEEESRDLKARKKVLMEQLEKDHGVTSIKAAMKKVKEMEAEIKSMDTQINEASEALENQLNEAD